MERENQIEMIKKYGNKNSCYIPFIGGGKLSTSFSRFCKDGIFADSTDFIIQRL